MPAVLRFQDKKFCVSAISADGSKHTYNLTNLSKKKKEIAEKSRRKTYFICTRLKKLASLIEATLL